MKGEVHDEAALVMAPDDTVATALEDLDAGRTFDVDGREVELVETVEFGHKFALRPHAAGEDVRKYGEVVGRASDDIRAGEHVHTHNCESARGRGDLAAREDRGRETAESADASAGAGAGPDAGPGTGLGGGDGAGEGGERR
jgi:altronate dehydratase small subunit